MVWHHSIAGGRRKGQGLPHNGIITALNNRRKVSGRASSGRYR